MKFLSIDTSTKYSVVAISDQRGFLAGGRRLLRRGHSQGLFALITSCLKKAALTLPEVGYFGVGVGPGSFTGLRVGLSAVKAFAYSLGKPCIVFSSLDAIAFNKLDARVGHLGVLVDARRSNVYCRLYRLQRKTGRREGLVRVSEDLLLGADEFLARLPKETLLCGDGVALYRAQIEAACGCGRFAPQTAWYPTPRSLARLTREAFLSRRFVDSFHLLPRYLYRRDCQVNR